MVPVVPQRLITEFSVIKRRLRYSLAAATTSTTAIHRFCSRLSVLPAITLLLPLHLGQVTNHHTMQVTFLVSFKFFVYHEWLRFDNNNSSIGSRNGEKRSGLELNDFWEEKYSRIAVITTTNHFGQTMSNKLWRITYQAHTCQLHTIFPLFYLLIPVLPVLPRYYTLYITCVTYNFSTGIFLLCFYSSMVCLANELKEYTHTHKNPIHSWQSSFCTHLSILLSLQHFI